MCVCYLLLFMYSACSEGTTLAVHDGGLVMSLQYDITGMLHLPLPHMLLCFSTDKFQCAKDLRNITLTQIVFTGSWRNLPQPDSWVF